MHSKRAAFWSCDGVWFVSGTNLSVRQIVSIFRKQPHYYIPERGKWKVNEVLRSPEGNKHSTYNEKEKANWTGHI